MHQPIGKGRIVLVCGPQWISTLGARISDLGGTAAKQTSTKAPYGSAGHYCITNTPLPLVCRSNSR
jgi:hypothetical protein